MKIRKAVKTEYSISDLFIARSHKKKQNKTKWPIATRPFFLQMEFCRGYSALLGLIFLFFFFILFFELFYTLAYLKKIAIVVRSLGETHNIHRIG